MSKKSDILRRVVGDTSFIYGGYQVGKARTYNKRIPAWANNDVKITQFITRAFPKLSTNTRQQELARRWARVVHLYFRMGYTNTQIAKEMNLTPGQVRRTVQSLQRAAKGLWSDGAGKHGVRRRGRPSPVPPACIVL
jgi:hypothetical protein